MEKYIDRKQAGVVLAQALEKLPNKSNMIALALPRGGVPVAFEIAIALSIPLDVFIVRKLGVPGHEELAMGAIASGGIVILNQELINMLQLDESTVNRVIEAEKAELIRREALYRPGEPPHAIEGKTVLLVDDGIATGSTMHAAVLALRKLHPEQIIIAVPVAALDTFREMEPLVEKIVCPLTPLHFYAVGMWYENFTQTSDEEVCALLTIANQQDEE